ncbi:MAG: 2OG-Fe(II) oxygenase [Bacteroidetes bacterium]|nr:2OG-Fe(II) oxygenase [Bacteroidota bacterium]
MKKTELDSFIYLIEDFLTADECDNYIIWSEQKGYEEAKVQVYGTQMMMKAVRNNSRITFIDHELAGKIWDRFKPFAQERFANSHVLGLNEMFRFYKYEPGQRFKKHIDGSYIRNAEESSYFTLLIYLNDDFEGGETTFQYHTVKPKKGTALVFYHGIRHAGEPITRGTKYVLRTDVMYKLIA